MVTLLEKVAERMAKRERIAALRARMATDEQNRRLEMYRQLNEQTQPVAEQFFALNPIPLNSIPLKPVPLRQPVDVLVEEKTAGIMNDYVKDLKEHMAEMQRLGKNSPAYKAHKVEMFKTLFPKGGLTGDAQHCKASLEYVRLNSAPELLQARDAMVSNPHALVSNYHYKAAADKNGEKGFVQTGTLVKDIEKAVADYKKTHPNSQLSDEAIRGKYIDVNSLHPGDEVHVKSSAAGSGYHAMVFGGKDENGDFICISHNPEEIRNLFKNGRDAVPARVYDNYRMVANAVRENYNEKVREGGVGQGYAYLEETKKPGRDQGIRIAGTDANFPARVFAGRERS